MLSARFRVLVLAALAVSIGAVALPASARCRGEGIWLKTEAPIPTNGRIVIDAFAQSREILASIEKRHPQLRSGKDVVPLIVVERRSGEVGLDQIVLAPARALAPSATY